ncbi:hypothetical protein OPV22_020358 [Ensete ventricosum]|uniref:VQ domain-containing protein n=1 Tax=Ensete ventricosum TaxID=4639 RepID=A0AAV8P9T4_ENSVE|nr:hypothetical protein OPV22_020358 [Ensete ventricosum]RWV90808.1 hypothetical protein GW17_00046959 [Ensete ventricosum]RWW90026.1 hypothetical protein BHE74_00000830 [Ensete ventricosum]RZR77934.1 hypothetical protein BHM03_00003143 [Ensete ventricosum]
MSSDLARRPMKVRVIVTKCVQVDAVQFKSVVQCLTGKDSVVAETSESPGGGRGRSHAVERSCGGKRKRPISAEQAAGEGGIMLLPSLDELLELLSD